MNWAEWCQFWFEISTKTRAFLISKGHILDGVQVEITEEYYKRWAPVKIGRKKGKKDDYDD